MWFLNILLHIVYIYNIQKVWTNVHITYEVSTLTLFMNTIKNSFHFILHKSSQKIKKNIGDYIFDDNITFWTAAKFLYNLIASFCIIVTLMEFKMVFKHTCILFHTKIHWIKWCKARTKMSWGGDDRKLGLEKHIKQTVSLMNDLFVHYLAQGYILTSYYERSFSNINLLSINWIFSLFIRIVFNRETTIWNFQASLGPKTML